MGKKSNIGDITLSAVKLLKNHYIKITVFSKRVNIGKETHRSMEENRNSYTNAYRYDQLIYIKGVHGDTTEKKVSTKWKWNHDSHIQETHLGFYFAPYQKLKSQWIKDLNVRSKTVKLLQDGWRENRLSTCLARRSGLDPQHWAWSLNTTRSWMPGENS